MIVLVLVCAGCVYAQDRSATETEFWPEADIFWKFNDHIRLLFLTAWAKDRDEEAHELEIGAFLDVFVPRFRPLLFRRTSNQDDARARRIALRAGYRHVRYPNRDSKEDRLETDATLRWVLPASLLMSDRNRGEYRFIDGDFAWRFRHELKFERDFEIARLPVTPYVSGEIFYDSRFETISRWRLTAGSTFRVSPRWAIEPYYTRQIARELGFRKTQAAGLTVIFYGP